MKINHLFIFSSDHGQETDLLIEHGFLEGSKRIHPGQGTRNRKIYFENFYLEIIWVHNQSEIKSKLTAPTGLWERSQFMTHDISRFGLCLDATEDLDESFKDSLKYYPTYLDPNLFLKIHTAGSPHFPWICRLPIQKLPSIHDQPITHKNGIQRLTKICFHIPSNVQGDHMSYMIEKLGPVEFINSNNHRVVLEFDHCQQKKSIAMNELSLTVKY